MSQTDRRMAAMLAGLAGYVDAIGFLASGGYFVSFMSGNSTRLAVGLVHDLPAAGLAGGLILIFVAGVTAGSLVAQASQRPRTMVLMLVAALLFIAAGLATLPARTPGLAALALAMGATNAALDAATGPRVGVTYMTGTLVKLGQRLAARLLGDGDADVTPYALHWLSLIAGAIAGAIAFRLVGAAALWAPAVLTGAIVALLPGRGRSGDDQGAL